MSVMRGRSVALRALAKINLDLRVLHKRPDGFHELRTIFQTISLADSIEIEYTPARSTRIELETDIPNNLIVRAAEPGGAIFGGLWGRLSWATSMNARPKIRVRREGQ